MLAQMSLRFDEPTRLRLRRALLRKGHTIATLLADVLAGKDKGSELSNLPMFDKPGLRPEEKLRMYLDHVESCRILLDNDDDRFGRCTECDADLGLLALEQMPWADQCQTCQPPHLRA